MSVRKLSNPSKQLQVRISVVDYVSDGRATTAIATNPHSSESISEQTPPLRFSDLGFSFLHSSTRFMEIRGSVNMSDARNKTPKFPALYCQVLVHRRCHYFAYVPGHAAREGHGHAVLFSNFHGAHANNPENVLARKNNQLPFERREGI
jgi:hypothetical protein